MITASIHDREGVVMDMFTTGLQWSSIQRLFSRSPLVRAVDRVEAVVMLVAAVVSLLAAPFAATAVGIAVHYSRSHLYAEQPHARHAGTATATDIHAAGTESLPPHPVFEAPGPLGHQRYRTPRRG